MYRQEGVSTVIHWDGTWFYPIFQNPSIFFTLKKKKATEGKDTVKDKAGFVTEYGRKATP